MQTALWGAREPRPRPAGSQGRVACRRASQTAAFSVRPFFFKLKTLKPRRVWGAAHEALVH